MKTFKILFLSVVLSFFAVLTACGDGVPDQVTINGVTYPLTAKDGVQMVKKDGKLVSRYSVDTEYKKKMDAFVSTALSGMDNHTNGVVVYMSFRHEDGDHYYKRSLISEEHLTVFCLSAIDSVKNLPKWQNRDSMSPKKLQEFKDELYAKFEKAVKANFEKAEPPN